MMENLLYQQMAMVAGRATDEEISRLVAVMTDFVKLRTGVGNNCAIAIVRRAHDFIAGRRRDDHDVRIAGHPRYKHQVKRLFQQYFREWELYEKQLLFPAEGSLRMFSVKELLPDVRKRYGDITDREYFEFWKASGALAINRSEPLVLSMQHKYELSLAHHGVEHAGLVAWAMTGQAALELAVELYDRSVMAAAKEMPECVSKDKLRTTWADLSLKKLAATWKHAMQTMAPETVSIQLEELELNNIIIGLRQLKDLWMSADLFYDSTIQAVDDYAADVFKTVGMAKKTMREFSEMRNEG